MSERAKISALATWVGAQIKALKAADPTYRKASMTTSAVLALGTATDVTVTWSSALPDANYLCWAQPTGTTGVSTQVAMSIKSQSATGCVVTIRPPIALAAGFTFSVFALRFPT